MGKDILYDYADEIVAWVNKQNQRSYQEPEPPVVNNYTTYNCNHDQPCEQHTKMATNIETLVQHVRLTDWLLMLIAFLLFINLIKY